MVARTIDRYKCVPVIKYKVNILNELAHQFIQNNIMTIFDYPWTVHGQSGPTGLTQRLAVVLP